MSWANIAVFLVTAVAIDSSNGDCASNSCYTTFKTPSSKTCDHVKTLLKCLEDASTQCTLTSDQADVVNGVTSCTLSESCKCQKTYFEAAALNCVAKKEKVTCLYKQSDVGCSTSTTPSNSDLRKSAAQAVKDEAGCDLSASCKCEDNYLSAATKDCTAKKAKVTCLYSATDVGCDGTTTNEALRKSSAQEVKDQASCDLSASCKCEDNYLSAVTKDCTAKKTKVTCLYKATDDCGKTNDELRKAAVKLVADETSCSLTATCQCQTAYDAADKADKTKKCSALSTFSTCLGNITSTTEVSCDGTTKAAAAKTSADKTYTDDKCSGAVVLTISTFGCILLMLIGQFVKI